jgi:hypothetical protein
MKNIDFKAASSFKASVVATEPTPEKFNAEVEY